MEPKGNNKDGKKKLKFWNKLKEYVTGWFPIKKQDNFAAFLQYPFVRYAIIAALVIIALQVQVAPITDFRLRIVLMGFCILASLLISLVTFSNAETKEQKILRIDDYHEELKRTIRNIKSVGNFDQIRHRIVAKKIELNQLVRERAEEGKITSVSTELSKLQEEFAKFADDATFAQVIPIDDEGEEYIQKTKDDGSPIDKESISLKNVKNKIVKLKNDKREVETKLVTENFMPFVGFLSLAALFSIMAISETTLWLIIDKADSPYFFTISRVIFLITLVMVGYYLQDSRTQIEKTDKGVKFFRSKPYAIVSRGPRLALKPFVDIEEISTEVQRYDLEPFQAKIADWRDSKNTKTSSKRSQTVNFNVSILFHIERPIDAITELGKKFSNILFKLRGNPESKDPKEKLGIIGDHVQSFIRSFCAEWIRSLDEAYQVQEDIAADLRESLKENLEYLGIRIDNVFVTNVRGVKEVEEARNEREIATIKRDEAEVEKEITILKSEATAEETKNLGFAKAAVDKNLGFAKAAVEKEVGKKGAEVIAMEIKAKIRALTSISPDAKTKALDVVPLILPLLLGDKVLPKIAEGLQGMNLSIYALSDVRKAIQEMLGSKIGSFLGAGSGTGGKS